MTACMSENNPSFLRRSLSPACCVQEDAARFAQKHRAGHAVEKPDDFRLHDECRSASWPGVGRCATAASMKEFVQPSRCGRKAATESLQETLSKSIV
jgi:hypothetical protein